MTAEPARTESQGFLSALAYPAYRYLWISTIGNTIVMSMEMVAIGWLVLELTNSPFLVGLAAACRSAGMVLSPFLGALADRFNRRNILVLERGASISYVLLLAVLYYTSLIQPWHIFVLVLIGGGFRALDFTTRMAIAPDTVESHNLASAIGLLFANQGISMAVGSLLAGYLLGIVGGGGSFLIMAALYLISCLLALPIRLKPAEKKQHVESVWGSMLSGINYVVRDRGLLALIVIAAIVNLFAFPCVVSLMPVFARDVLQLGADGLGQLTAAEGIGALCGSLLASSLGRFRHKGWLFIAFTIAWPAMLGIFSTLRLFPVNLTMLVLSGMSRGICLSFNQILLMAWSTEDMRGRVSGARMCVIAMSPLGSILSGAGAGLWGAATMVLINAVSCIFFTLVTVLWAPEIHRRQ